MGELEATERFDSWEGSFDVKGSLHEVSWEKRHDTHTHTHTHRTRWTHAFTQNTRQREKREE